MGPVPGVKRSEGLEDLVKHLPGIVELPPVVEELDSERFEPFFVFHFGNGLELEDVASVAGTRVKPEIAFVGGGYLALSEKHVGVAVAR